MPGHAVKCKCLAPSLGFRIDPDTLFTVGRHGGVHVARCLSAMLALPHERPGQDLALIIAAAIGASFAFFAACDAEREAPALGTPGPQG